MTAVSEQPGEKDFNTITAAVLDEGFDANRITATYTPQADWTIIEPLCQRELEVVSLISDGLSNQQIADRLILSLGTVKWYIHQIYCKLGVQNRVQAIRRTQELNLLSERLIDNGVSNDERTIRR
jgi:ATP/maltotriose-dependent transcriptional regulator MalT